MSVAASDVPESGGAAVDTADLVGSIGALPESVPEATTAWQRAGQKSASQYRRVLVVEDELALRRIIARNLTSRGVDVREAGSAGEAIHSAITDRPDLLLLDINLPDQTGWDVMRELRRRGTDVPTIIVSAVRVSQNRLDEFHPIAYLPKPFPIEALLRLVFDSPRRRPLEDSGEDGGVPPV